MSDRWWEDHGRRTDDDDWWEGIAEVGSRPAPTPIRPTSPVEPSPAPAPVAVAPVAARPILGTPAPPPAPVDRERGLRLYLQDIMERLR